MAQQHRQPGRPPRIDQHHPNALPPGRGPKLLVGIVATAEIQKVESEAVYLERVRRATQGDLKRVAQQYLQNGAMTVISSEEKIAEANAQMDGVFAVEAV